MTGPAETWRFVVEDALLCCPDCSECLTENDLTHADDCAQVAALRAQGAAAERQRITELAEQRGAVCARLPDRPLAVTSTGTVTVWEGGSLPPVIPFADLIREAAP